MPETALMWIVFCFLFGLMHVAWLGRGFLDGTGGPPGAIRARDPRPAILEFARRLAADLVSF